VIRFPHEHDPENQNQIILDLHSGFIFGGQRRHYARPTVRPLA
jgi:hypothetical protein